MGALKSLKRERFCILYASDREFFGNGVQAYAEAYGIDLSIKGSYNAARASASELLTNPNILNRINELLELNGLNDAFVDKQLNFMVVQNADFKAKISAIKEYNALKKRTAGNAINLNVYETKEKIKGFLDESDDSAYNEGGAEPSSSDVSEDTTEV